MLAFRRAIAILIIAITFCHYPAMSSPVEEATRSGAVSPVEVVVAAQELAGQSAGDNGSGSFGAGFIYERFCRGWIALLLLLVFVPRKWILGERSKKTDE